MKLPIKWLIRFIKYNLVGVTAWIANLAFYQWLYYPLWREWAIIPFSASGAIIEFTALNFVNKTKHGKMFDNCTE